MPFYQRLGDLPRKRHIVHRDNGTLLTEGDPDSIANDSRVKEVYLGHGEAHV